MNKLALLLGLSGLNGSVALAALSGLFRPGNAFSLAIDRNQAVRICCSGKICRLHQTK